MSWWLGCGSTTVLACAVISLALLIPGLATPMYTLDGREVEITPFALNDRSGHETLLMVDWLCGAQKARFRTIQAFGIMSTIFAGINAAVAGCALPAAACPAECTPSRYPVFLSAAFSAFTAAFALVAWVVVVDTYISDLCGGRFEAYWSYGPTMYLWVTAFVLLVVGAVAGGFAGGLADVVPDESETRVEDVVCQEEPVPCLPASARARQDPARVAELSSHAQHCAPAARISPNAAEGSDAKGEDNERSNIDLNKPAKGY